MKHNLGPRVKPGATRVTDRPCCIVYSTCFGGRPTLKIDHLYNSTRSANILPRVKEAGLLFHIQGAKLVRTIQSDDCHRALPAYELRIISSDGFWCVSPTPALHHYRQRCSPQHL